MQEKELETGEGFLQLYCMDMININGPYTAWRFERELSNVKYLLKWNPAMTIEYIFVDLNGVADVLANHGRQNPGIAFFHKCPNICIWLLEAAQNYGFMNLYLCYLWFFLRHMDLICKNLWRKLWETWFVLRYQDLPLKRMTAIKRWRPCKILIFFPCVSSYLRVISF